MLRIIKVKLTVVTLKMLRNALVYRLSNFLAIQVLPMSPSYQIFDPTHGPWELTKLCQKFFGFNLRIVKFQLSASGFAQKLYNILNHSCHHNNFKECF